MRQLVLLVALAALGGACKAKNPDGTDRAEETTSILANLPTPDWSGKKLVTLAGEIGGFTFKIDVPDGLPRDKRNQADWESADLTDEFVPKVFTSTIEIRLIQDLTQAKYHATLDAGSKNWVREQSRPDSWALTMAEPDKHRIEAITYKQASDTVFIKCKAVQYGNAALPSYDKTRTMLEKICDSLREVKEVVKPEGGASAQAEEPKPEEPKPE